VVRLASPSNDLGLRRKAAFWLANQRRGKEGLLANQRFAREDANPKVSEKLAFDHSIERTPAALNE